MKIRISKHGFSINENSVDGSNCSLNNIIALPSISTQDGIKVVKSGNVEDSILWSELDDGTKKQIIGEYMRKVKEKIDKHKSEGNNLNVYEGVFVPPVHLGRHDAKIIKAENVLEEMAGEDVRYSYEECMHIENAKIEEKKFNEIKNGNYRCSDMEKAREQFQAEMNEMIKKAKEKYLQYVNKIASEVTNEMKGA
ncbi:hypothetical protein [Acetivibrio saccincola]|jgi:hypothetical protein|uniref:Uncharacterized protein n=1 Tax=Acetivibrio saccincola TaxID=1677857 RepID=A0A2S8RBK0_9FIRM|nr:hypothetical protein [Acetivibrio saccincola]PQQ67155.1 hypothetical protein B9R14_10625 [Acetivibrio saccincola]